MGIRASIQASASGRCRRVIVGALAAVLLPAVPALATISFLGSWKVKTKTHDGAPKPIVTTTDDASGTHVTIAMGSTTSRDAEARVTLTRKFRMLDEEVVNLQHMFSSLIRDTSIRFKAKVNEGGPRLDEEFKAKGDARTASANEISSRRLRPRRTYTVKIDLKYENEHGSWENFDPHRIWLTTQASPSKLAMTGV